MVLGDDIIFGAPAAAAYNKMNTFTFCTDTKTHMHAAARNGDDFEHV